MGKEETSIIQSVDRALILLKAIADDPRRGKSLNELTAVLKIDRSSVFRSLTTLMKHGLIRQDRTGKMYLLGYGIYGLAGSLRVQDKLTDTASPILRELVDQTGENAHLAVRSRSVCVFIDREQGDKALNANTDIGSSEELYCTAVGKALICDLSREELEKTVPREQMRIFTENTITDLDRLSRELKGIRERGVSVDNEEYEYNVICCAAPVYNYEGKIEAAIGISGPKIRMENRMDEIIEIVGEAGKRLSGLFGYRSNKKL